MKREIYARLFVLLIILSLSGAVAPAYSQAPPSPDPAQTAEEIYQEAKALVESDQTTADTLQQAMTKVHEALALVPESCKYTFAISLLHYRLKDWNNASQWFSKAAALPAAQCAQYDINLWLSMAREKQLASRPVLAMAGEVEVTRHFSLKEVYLMAETEFSPSGPESVLPQVRLEAPDDALRDLLTARLGSVQFYRQGPFLLCGRENTAELEKHYQKGIVDAYRFIVKEYGFQEPDSVMTVLVSKNPNELISLAKKIYPGERCFPYNNSFFGFYAKNDHLLVATVRGGYGTLLHELMHALIADDSPDAPLWLVEGLATLYERSGWTTRRLLGLPNWRMEFIRYQRPVKLAEFEQITGQEVIYRDDLAFIRLIMLFIDDKEQVGRLYREAKSEGASFSVTQWLHDQGPEFSEQAWQEFFNHSLAVYLAEVQRESGRLHFQQVMFIQKALNTIMQAGLEEDGLWGSNTRAKLQEFQEKNGLPANGNYTGQVQTLLEQQFGASNL
ncbi:MAG: peptidoglycan-binding protein [Proteobacteria bacterium]|nr:peptidoglycan-binding protein [Pseudomonadota bacterium]MBU4295429.1 peptidoglycan-binding protein [Pseudomonadota bacterium]MCG2747899.1 peptidoglycan-binding protein [Desulfobulbaceae bacterium]